MKINYRVKISDALKVAQKHLPQLFDMVDLYSQKVKKTWPRCSGIFKGDKYYPYYFAHSNIIFPKFSSAGDIDYPYDWEVKKDRAVRIQPPNDGRCCLVISLDYPIPPRPPVFIARNYFELLSAAETNNEDKDRLDFDMRFFVNQLQDAIILYHKTYFTCAGRKNTFYTAEGLANKNRCIRLNPDAVEAIDSAKRIINRGRRCKG